MANRDKGRKKWWGPPEGILSKILYYLKIAMQRRDIIIDILVYLTLYRVRDLSCDTIELIFKTNLTKQANLKVQ